MSAEFFFYILWFKLWLEPLDNFFSYLSPTSYEQKNCKGFNIRSFTMKIFWFLVAFLMSPFGIAGYVTWFIIFRKVLRYKNYQESFKESNESYSLINKEIKTKSFELLSINVCLMPESLSRQNNLCKTKERLVSLGNLINKTATNTFCYSNFNESKEEVYNFKNIPIDKKIETNVKIIDDFIDGTDIDFLCLQEVWTIDTAVELKEILHKKYPFIIYDAGEKNFKNNKYVGLESGLLTASKYPILAADFKQYTTKSGLCCYTSKGLLLTKVLIGRDEYGRSSIGFISNSHLQSYQNTDSGIHGSQLNEIQLWVNDFKKKNHDSNNESIAFDLVCGDFNIDNMSPVDKDSFEHGIFKEFIDPLVIEPGIDHPNAIGTEMRYYSLYHGLTSCPKKFKNALNNDRVRRFFILDSNIEISRPEMCMEIPEIDGNDGLPLFLANHGGNRRVDSEFKMFLMILFGACLIDPFRS